MVGITIDAENTRAVIDLEESLSASFIPFNLLSIDRVRIITILDLVKSKEDGKIYIQRQFGELPSSFSFDFEGRMERGVSLLMGFVDAVPMDSLQALVPFGFLYGWWRGLATLTARVVGGGMQVVGLW